MHHASRITHHPSCHSSRYTRCPIPQSNNGGQHNSVAIQYTPGLFSFLSSYGTRAVLRLFSSIPWSSVPAASSLLSSSCISLIMRPTDSYTSPVQRYRRHRDRKEHKMEKRKEKKRKVDMQNGTHPCPGLCPFRRIGGASTRHNTRSSNAEIILPPRLFRAQTLWFVSERESSYDASDDVLYLARNPNRVLTAKTTPAFRSLSKFNKPSTIGARRSSVDESSESRQGQKMPFSEWTGPFAERYRRISVAIFCTRRRGTRNAFTTCGTKFSVTSLESTFPSSAVG